ncbi:hypothetical protein DSO57_1003200 [Entomophthora muscae]|uniref:Uncharacterized protein n=1 Tax=Entomophthora muscae TaxID=34485 RepID=A0ACC2RZN4_9FUNG|nr:hypothetical protein DSO57_1003200 [Entomophthora muscae]
MARPPSFSKLYNSNFLSDVKFVETPQDSNSKLSLERLSISDNECELYAHKVILANNSAFFKEMFSSDMQESTASEIKLWCPINVFEVVLRYISTQTIDCDLFETSDFHLWAKVFEEAKLIGIPGLQKLALWFAYCLADPKNIFDLLNMCREQKDCGFILQDVLKYIGNNWDDI